MINGYKAPEHEPESTESESSKKRVLLLLIPLFLILAGIAAFFAYRAWLEYQAADEEYDIIRNDYTDEVPETESESAEEDADPFPDLDIDVDGLFSENPDFLCWLYYEDMNVSYPVMLEPEDEYNKYLHMTFEGESNYAGCLFVPPETDPGFHDLNSFIYGHNMHDGSMFGTFNDVYNDMENNFMDPYFYLWTRDHERMIYRVISMFVVDKNDQMYAIPQNTEGYEIYLERSLTLGSTDGFIPFTDIEHTAMADGKPIVSLSTCYGPSGTSDRLIVQGVEIYRDTF